MDTPSTHVMTIANSIIGVSLLAMPYCFKQCGILLSILMLILSSIISRLACHFLLKSAIKARLKTFEFLAYHAFGPFGKFMIEIGMIGFLLGTCIAFFVVMGDLGPQIVSQMAGLKTTSTIRTSTLVILAVFCILPLGLLRNVDSLNGVCTATIGFYICLVLKIMGESAPHILVGDWYDKVEFWRADGLLQCIPIFSMALFCQTQLFEIYQAIPNASLERMNSLIRVAVNICTSVYIFVGIFGYIALANESFSGNVLMSFKPSIMTEIMKVGFVLSVAFSFPLIIFPCRASLFSLLYKPTYVLHDSGTNYIPEGKFRLLTVFIVSVSLVIGVLIPNIELVLGLVGSTIGVMICVLFPATCFICMSTKNTNERILAQVMLFVGIVVMVLGTYANLYAIEEAHLNPVTEKIEVIPLKVNANILKTIDDPVLSMPTTIPEAIGKHLRVELEKNDKTGEVMKEVRHEPPQPVEPEEVPVEKPKQVPPVKSMDIEESDKKKEMSNSKNDLQEENASIIKSNDIVPDLLNELNVVSVVGTDIKKELNIEPVKEPTKENPPQSLEESQKVKIESNRSEQVDIEAIKKEDKEMIQQEKENDKEYEKKLDLKVQIDQLQKQNEVQQQIFQEQKKLLEEIKQRQKALMSDQGQNEIDKVIEEKKIKAVKEIETIAKEAIKSLVDNDINHKAQNLDELKIKPSLANMNAINTDGAIKPIVVNINTDTVQSEVAKIDAAIKPEEMKLPLKLSNDGETSQTLNLTASDANGQQHSKTVNLDNLMPIPLAKSNNVSVFAGMNLFNDTVNLKPDNLIRSSSNAVVVNISNENNNIPANADVPNSKMVNNKLEIVQSKLTDESLDKTKITKVVPDETLKVVNVNDQNLVKPDETLLVYDKKISEKVEEKQNPESQKKRDIQAMRRDILSQEPISREKRDTYNDAVEACEKLKTDVDSIENKEKSSISNEILKSQAIKEGTVNKQNDKGREPKSAEEEDFKKIESLQFHDEQHRRFNLNLDSIDAKRDIDLAKSMLDNSFNIYKNRKK